MHEATVQPRLLEEKNAHFFIPQTRPLLGFLPTENIPFKYSSEKLAASLIVPSVVAEHVKNYTLFCNQPAPTDQIRSMLPSFNQGIQKPLNLRQLIYHFGAGGENQVISGFGYQTAINRQSLSELKNLAAQLSLFEDPQNFVNDRYLPPHFIEHDLASLIDNQSDDIFLQEKTGKITKARLVSKTDKSPLSGENRLYLLDNDRTFSAWCAFSTMVYFSAPLDKPYRAISVETKIHLAQETTLDSIDEIVDVFLGLIPTPMVLGPSFPLLVASPFLIITSALSQLLSQRINQQNVKVYTPDIFVGRGWAPTLSFLQALFAKEFSGFSFINLEDFPKIMYCVVKKI